MQKDTTYILVRHGQSEHNKSSREIFAGSLLNTDLTQTGRDETQVLAEKIIQNQKIDRIISSPLERAVQTAEIIQKIIAKRGNKIVPLEIINDLAEINVGDFTGHTSLEVDKLFPGQSENFTECRYLKWDFPHGECYKEIKSAIQTAFQSIFDTTTEDSTDIIVCHAMLYQVIFYLLDPLKRVVFSHQTHINIKRSDLEKIIKS